MFMKDKWNTKKRDAQIIAAKYLAKANPKEYRVYYENGQLVLDEGYPLYRSHSVIWTRLHMEAG